MLVSGIVDLSWFTCMYWIL